MRHNDCVDNYYDFCLPEADSLSTQVSENDQDDPMGSAPRFVNREPTPSSPPPSFRSRASSPSSRRLLFSEDPIASEAERTLADTFDDGSDSDEDGTHEGDDRQRLMRTNTTRPETEQGPVHDGDRPNLSTEISQFPGAISLEDSNVPVRPPTAGAPLSSFSHSNDGVFANLNAKPERGEKLEELPPVNTIFPFSVYPSKLLTNSSPTKRPLQTLLPLTGKPLSSHLVILPPLTKSLLTACQSVRSSASYGTV